MNWSCYGSLFNISATRMSRPQAQKAHQARQISQPDFRFIWCFGDLHHRKQEFPWYAETMLRGVFQRAAVAIVLMGSLLAPFGTCLQRTHKAAHSCCSHASESRKTAQTNCCIASAPLPAVVVAPNLPGSAPMTVAQEFISLDEFSSRSEFPILAVIPPHSPPTGAFNLRI